MTELTNQTAIITGSARGIGKAIALRFATLGANIVVNYSGGESEAATTVAQIQDHGVEAVAIRADVSKPTEVERLFTEAVARFGQISIVVANAGKGIINQSILEATEEDLTAFSPSIPRARSSRSRRRQAKSRTTAESSTSDRVRPACRPRESAFTERAKWPHATWSAS